MKAKSLIVTLLFFTNTRAQLVKDFSVKAGVGANSLYHKELNGSTRIPFHKYHTPYNYIGYFVGGNTTFVFGKRVNIGLEVYFISKGYNSPKISFAASVKAKSKIDYAGFSLPLKWKFKRTQTPQSRRFYFITAPRVDFDLNSRKRYPSGTSAYDSTKKIIPGLYIAPGVEWKREKFSIGFEIFWSIDLKHVYDYDPQIYEPVIGKHNTLGINLVYRRYYMKSKTFYEKYY